uniref:Uncharacterized protein n=1 Tax=Myoviridae sp. ctlnK45 TaxID=2826693 RepID=A0A8S5NPP1_9CAUD|nr:MAG TPA: hypothetical protein [Myoviridae sp. ctlnK45]
MLRLVLIQTQNALDRADFAKRELCAASFI